MTPNIENIDRLIAILRKDLEEHDGKHFAMDLWAIRSKDIGVEYPPTIHKYEPCKTAMCLGGHIKMITDREKGIPLTEITFDRYFDYDGRGAQWLGLNYWATLSLFRMASLDRHRFDLFPAKIRIEATIEVLEGLKTLPADAGAEGTNKDETDAPQREAVRVLWRNAYTRAEKRASGEPDAPPSVLA